MGVLVAVGGAVLVSLVLRRHLDADLSLAGSLRDLGLDPRAAVRLAVVKGSALGAAGAVVAVGVAIALSPLTPIGYPRRAEIDPCVAVDLRVLGPGALLVALLVVGRVVVPVARRGTSTDRAPADAPVGSLGAALSEGAARGGLPPSAVAGLRAAVLSAGAGTVVATVFAATLGTVGSLGFASSEARLASDPDLWGWTFDVVVGDGNDPEIGERADDPRGAARARHPARRAGRRGGGVAARRAGGGDGAGPVRGPHPPGPGAAHRVIQRDAPGRRLSRPPG